MAMPMSRRPRPRGVGTLAGGGPSVQAGGSPPAPSQPGTPAPPVDPQRDAGAMAMYQNALLRRMQAQVPQGGAPGVAPPQQGAPGAPPQPEGIGAGGVPGMMGGAPGQQEEGGDINDIIRGLMATRFSRRVLGRGNGR